MEPQNEQVAHASELEPGPGPEPELGHMHNYTIVAAEPDAVAVEH